jgi:hypothetical protein
MPRAHVALLAKESALAAGFDAPVGRATAEHFAAAVAAGRGSRTIQLKALSE